jgi:predicted aspartyl protease
MLMLPQELVDALGLQEVRRVKVTYAAERSEERPVAEGVTIRVGNRSALAQCIVGPPGSEPLLGQVELELMDLLVDCPGQRLIPNPASPDMPLIPVK